MIISIDGNVVPPERAALPVLDHGLLYGDGVFEGLRIYHRRLFRLDDHLRRLAVSASAIGLEIPGGIGAIRRIVLETARHFEPDEGYVRLLITRGTGPLGVDPTTCNRPRVVCIVAQLEMFPSGRGISLVTVSVRRPPADVLDPRWKTLNYLNSVLAKREARLRGADDALVLNQAGAIAEASGANVFCVKRGVVRTPPPTDGALEGIVRGTILEIATSLGIPNEERTLGRTDLFAADEAFLTGTGARLVPVRSLDGVEIGSEIPGPITKSLLAAFIARTRLDGVPIPTVKTPLHTEA